MSGSEYLRAADILANAGFTEDRARLALHLLSDAQLLQVISSRLMGYRPVRVDWPDGTTALMPIPPGAKRPPASEVVLAYEIAKASGAVWPEVVQA